jgi:hypothetical protein
MNTSEGKPPARSEDAAFNEVLRHYITSIEQQIEQAKRTLALDVLPALRSCGVANIEAAYSGYGDSGAIDGIQYRDEAGMRVDRTALPAPVIEQLETALYEFLPAGFEINDGGQGTLTLDIQTAKVTVQHQENYTDTRDSTQEFTL